MALLDYLRLSYYLNCMLLLFMFCDNNLTDTIEVVYRNVKQQLCDDYKITKIIHLKVLHLFLSPLVQPFDNSIECKKKTFKVKRRI